MLLWPAILPNPVTQYNEVGEPDDGPGRLAFRHENDGESAVTDSILPADPPLSPTDMPWKNKLHSSFTDNVESDQNVAHKLIDLDNVVVPAAKPKPKLKPNGAVPGKAIKDTRDPAKVLSDAFNIPTPDYFRPSEELKPKVKKLTLLEQAIKQAAVVDSEHKLRVAEMLGKPYIECISLKENDKGCCFSVYVVVVNAM